MEISSANKDHIEKDGSVYKIITDDPADNAQDFRKYSERISQVIAHSKARFTVGIFGGWGTGKTTMMRMIKSNLDENNKEENNKSIVTIWFDAWRYENEEYSALVPLVRTLIIGIQNAIIDNITNDKRKILKRIQKQFYKIGDVILRNIEPTIGGSISYYADKVEAGIKLDMSKMIDDYKSEGSFFHGKDKISFYEHISDRLQKELEKLRDDNYNFRFVVFIDDLDRCTPERALEILESIKTFFDIEGFIYVIGMDPTTIDTIIRTKYGEKSEIDGLHYLQKIVQLPFQIPVWSDDDLIHSIKQMTEITGLSNDITEKLLKSEIKNLIINSAKLNPRNIKRFINSIVLSYDTDNENLKTIDDQNLRNYIIENYIKSMISIQTFYFRGDKWLQFIKMIIKYNDRIQFLTHFITFIETQKITSFNDLKNKIKDTQILIYPKYNKKILEIYNKIIEINDDDFFTFLTQAVEPLLRIGKIENYLRAVDTKKDIDVIRNIQEIKGYESLNKLHSGIQSFNDYVQGSIIHLPYLPYLEFDLDDELKINLSNAFLYKANLIGIDLSGANLEKADLSWAKFSDVSDEDRLGGKNIWAEDSFLENKLPWSNFSGGKWADLSKANLIGAKLVESNLEWANLSGAELIEANLSGANLYGAYLTGALLYNADLTGANLSTAYMADANLEWAKLPKANLWAAKLPKANLKTSDLTEANLSGTNLSEANLEWANLPGANLSGSNLHGANLSGARLVDTNLSETDLSNANLSNSIIINIQNYETSIINDKTNFSNAISNDSNLRYYISQFTEHIPEIVNNKKELELKMRRRYPKEYINNISNIANLPEE